MGERDLRFPIVCGAVTHPFAVTADDGEAQVALRDCLVRPAGHVRVPVEHALAQVPAADAARKVQMCELPAG